MKIVYLTYMTKNKTKITAKFIKTIRGYIPVFIEGDNFIEVDKEDIISEEEIDLDKIPKSELFIK